MRSLTFLTGLAAVASAQLMPLSEIAKVQAPAEQGPTVGKGAKSESFPYNANSVYQSTYSSVFAKGSTSQKRNVFQRRHDGGDCSPQPLGAGPVPSSDTPEAFVASTAFSDAANGAQTPSGYVSTFKNLKASSQVPMGYLGYDSISSYDPSICSAKCDALAGCFAFDIYFERDPTIDPGVNCPNPASTTIIKCAYWGTTLEADTATNDGQYCEDFHIVIAGSNGYVRQKAGFNVPGYDGTFVGDKAINAPTECNSYIGYQLFNDGQPFDPNRCAAACKATSDYNIQYLNGRAICRFFDTYILSKNGVPQGQYCAMYTRSWDLSYATNDGQYDDQGNHYTISYSYIYSNSSDPGAQICDATCMSQKPCPGSSSSSSTVSSTSVSKSSSSTLTTSNKGTSSSSPITTTVSTTASGLSTTSRGSTTASTLSTSGVVSSTTKSSTLSTTTSCTTTTFQTSTRSSTTTTTTSKTTTTSSKPTSTQCFKLRASGPSYLNSLPYVSIGSAGKLSTCAASSAEIFTLDVLSRLTSASSGKCLSRSLESIFNPYYGYLSTYGITSMKCTKGSDGKLSVTGGFFGGNGLWVSKNNNGVMHGNCPGNGWDSFGLVIEYVDCPKQSGGNGNGNNWMPWLSWF